MPSAGSERALYHDGELWMQRRAGRLDPSAPYSRYVDLAMSDRCRARLGDADLAVVATVDADGRPWAWPLAGEPGFLATPDASTVRASGALPGGAAAHLAGEPAVGLVSMDFERRVRARVNGTGSVDGGTLTVAVGEAFTNCPKYVASRAGSATGASPVEVGRATALSEPQAALIAEADAFFLATRSRDGRLDASHRGGPPGFVAYDGRQLRFPDYAGNNMFQTLGNLHECGRAGLLFLDFERETWLQVAVDAEVAFDGPAAGAVTERVVRCRVREVVEHRGVGRRWQSLAPGRGVEELMFAA